MSFLNLLVAEKHAFWLYSPLSDIIPLWLRRENPLSLERFLEKTESAMLMMIGFHMYTTVDCELQFGENCIKFKFNSRENYIIPHFFSLYLTIIFCIHLKHKDHWVFKQPLKLREKTHKCFPFPFLTFFMF